MAAAPGTRFGAYEVLALLGAGGMGEVYRARDTKLGRDVALKVLPASFAEDADRIARFEREAKILASLNHPGIAQVYGFEDAPAASETRTCALVMELVEGQDLSHRLLRGPLSTDDALPLALQIADALDAAHDAGIVHRDLKPANIKVRDDGTIKVLDFGLAKAAAASGASGVDALNSPTITSPATLTMQGVILGTAAYMSPEQAKGKLVDKRADIWGFGCVLYEMLTGRRAFEGEDVAETLARVLDREPDWTRLPKDVPDHVRATIARCLTKSPRARMRDIGDVRHALERPLATRGVSATRPRAAAWLGWGIAAVMTAVAAALLWWRPQPMEAPRPVIRTSIELPTGHTLSVRDRSYPMAISADGARIAFVGDLEGRSQLFVRELSNMTATPLASTAGARQPFFSPDGRWIAFFAGQTLQRVAVDGGAPLRICDIAGRTAGGSWGAHDTIVVATEADGLVKVAAGGGAPQRIENTAPAAWPDLLPGGRSILYATGVSFPASAFAVIDLDGSNRRVVARTTDAGLDGPALLGTVEIAQPRYLPSGHIIYGQSPGVVRRVGFDRTSMTIVGLPASIADSVERGAGSGAVYFAASQTGLLTYVPTGERHQLVWVDRLGNETPISAERAAFRIPHVSPDGSRIAVSINDEARRSDIWIYDASRGTRDRLTTEHHNIESPWTPDGREIWFSSSNGIEAVPVDNPSGRRIEIQNRNIYPSAWTPDGRHLLYNATDATGRNIMMLTRGEAPRPLLNRPFNEWTPHVSPDGRWLAYSSDESGRYEIYVVRFPDLSGRVPISTDGGLYPIWSRDGRELFYRQGDAVMAVTVSSAGAFQAGQPRRLFSGAYTGTGQDPSFDVSLDGRRFVMVKSDEASTRRRITVVQNWNDAPAAR